MSSRKNAETGNKIYDENNMKKQDNEMALEKSKSSSSCALSCTKQILGWYGAHHITSQLHDKVVTMVSGSTMLLDRFIHSG